MPPEGDRLSLPLPPSLTKHRESWPRLPCSPIPGPGSDWLAELHLGEDSPGTLAVFQKLSPWASQADFTNGLFSPDPGWKESSPLRDGCLSGAFQR